MNLCDRMPLNAILALSVASELKMSFLSSHLHAMHAGFNQQQGSHRTWKTWKNRSIPGNLENLEKQGGWGKNLEKYCKTWKKILTSP